jgi:hypothetical protein
MTTEQNKELSSALLTAHIFSNQIALTKLIDFKEHIKANDKQLYQEYRTQINQAIRVQQQFHDTYKIAIGDCRSLDFYTMMDELLTAFDKTLLI